MKKINKYPKLSYRNSCHFCLSKGKCKYINHNFIRPFKYMLNKNGNCKRFKMTFILDNIITKKNIKIIVSEVLKRMEK